MANELEDYVNKLFQEQQAGQGQPAGNTQQGGAPSQVDDEELLKGYFSDAEEGDGGGQPQQPQQPQAAQPAAGQQPVQGGQQYDPQMQLEQYRAQLAKQHGELEAYKRMVEHGVGQQHQGTQPQHPSHPLDGLMSLPYDEKELEVTPEQLQTYSDANPFIESVVKRAINEYHKRVTGPMARYAQELERQVATASSGVNSAREQAFGVQVSTAVPDVRELTTHPQFAGFLNESPRYSGNRWTYADMLQDAIRTGNLPAVQDVLADFRTKIGKGQASAQQAMSPGRASTSLPNTAPAKTKKLAYSGLEKATGDYHAGRITYAQYEKIQQKFLEAEINGLVDYNK